MSISPGDEGGPLPLSSPQAGTITTGDLDVWTFTANAGEKYTVQINEVTAMNGFQPWIRVWTPAGGTLGSASGLTTASLTNFTVPVSGTYLVLVGSFDSGYDGEGTYNLTLTRTQ